MSGTQIQKPMKKIAILDTGYPSYEKERRLLHSNGYELVIFEGDRADITSRIRLAGKAEGIFVRWTRIDEPFLEKCPSLKAIVRYGAGYENIDLEAAARTGIRVANVGGYGNHSVSDHALALIFASARGLFPGVAGFRENFGKPPFERMIEFHRNTLGIIGLGRIGGTLASKAGFLFKEVLASDPYIADSRFMDLNVIKTDLQKLLKKSDVISIHCNLTEETTGLIGHQEFRKMDRFPILVNTARGPVIETGALLEALEQGKVHSAGLDVFHSEIPGQIDRRLLSHPRVIATGHFAWYSENSLEELQKRAAENMLALLAGKSPEDSLN